MKKLIMASTLGAAALLVSACGDRDAETEDTVVAEETAAPEPADTTSGTTASANWPSGTHIVEEGGATYRVNPDGTRVAIENNEWRIITEDGVRYRVDPTGARVRIDDRGFDIDVGINEKGNLDVDVGAEDRPG